MSAAAQEQATKRPSRKEYKRAVRKDTAKDDESSTKPKTAANEVRITASRGQRFYISYAIDIFNGENEKPKSDTVILSGMGEAIYNVVNIAEVLKRRVKGLHQTCEIGTQTMSDEYEPLKEGLPNLTVERKVSTITIVLSTKQLDTKHIGYQAPLPESEVTEGKPEPVARERKEGDKKEGGRRRRGGDKPAKKDGDKKPEGGRRGGDKKPEGGRRGGEGRFEGHQMDAGPDRGGRGGRFEGQKMDAAPARGGRGGRSGDAAPARGGRGRDERPARAGGDRNGDRNTTRNTDAPRGGRRAEGDRAPRGGRGAAAPATGGRGAPRGGAGGGRGGDRAARGGYEGGARGRR